MVTTDNFRNKINEVKTIGDLVDVIRLNNVHTTCTNSSYSYEISKIKGYLIGWNKDKTFLYVTKGGELILFAQDNVSKEMVDFILDDILDLNQTDSFYKLFFKAYGYEVPSDASDNVREAIKYFKDKTALVDSIYVSADYHSVTLTGRRYHNNNDIEYRIVNCTKEEILDIITITHVQPVVNRTNNVDFYDNPYGFRPPISDQQIMDSYNDYKDSLAYN